MTNKANKLIVKYRYLFLAAIILFALIKLCMIFSTRNGHHIDETWSYGLANSYFAPHIYTDRPDGLPFGRDDCKNIGCWIPGEVLKEYITVQPDERFSFSSVVYNKREDISPSLYELILHFVCSFFPNTFSWNYAFSINAVLYIIAIILVFFISRQFTRDEITSLAVTFCYVLSGAATANYLYLRVYPLFTTLTLALLYILSCISDLKRKRISFAYYVAAFLITFLGSFTHFYFLIIACFLTVTLAIYMLCKKEYDRFFRICYTELGSVLFYFNVYPYSLGRILPFVTGDDSMSAQSFPYFWELAVANKHFFQGTLGFWLDINIFDVVTFLFYFVVASILVFLVCFLFRKSEKFSGYLLAAKTKIKTLALLLKNFFDSFDASTYAALISTTIYMIVIPMTASLVNMGYVERYFFPAIVVFAIGIYSIFVAAIRKIHVKGRMFTMIIQICACLLMGIMLYRTDEFTSVFRFDLTEDSELHDAVAGKDCFVITRQPSNLVWLSCELMDCSNVYVELTNDLLKEKSSCPEMETGCYILINGQGFLSEDNAAQNDDDQSVGVIDYTFPSAEYTVDEYIIHLESVYNRRIIPVDTFKTNLMELYLYEIE